MAVILAKRILELALLPEDNLCPLWAILGSEYPSLHILGFDNKNAIDRNQNMINLGGAVACR